MQNFKYKKWRKNDMGPIGLGAIIALITAVIATAVSILKKKGSGGILDAGSSPLSKEIVLEEAFGSHMYADTVKLEQVTAWVKQRQNLLENGAKALVMKVTPEALRKLGVKAKLDGADDRYLVITVVTDKEQQMKDSILIKYDRLDAQLEQVLAKGDGMLVING